jgi:hypothetical protein
MMHAVGDFMHYLRAPKATHGPPLFLCGVPDRYSFIDFCFRGFGDFTQFVFGRRVDYIQCFR